MRGSIRKPSSSEKRRRIRLMGALIPYQRRAWNRCLPQVWQQYSCLCLQNRAVKKYEGETKGQLAPAFFLMSVGLFGAQTSIGPDFEFGESVFSNLIATAKESAQNGACESDGDAQDAGVFQREDGCVLNGVVDSGSRSVDAHDAGAKDDQHQRGNE